MIGYRHADPRYPFLWEDSSQPAGRWHGPGEGPVNYFADTPDGAWAEFLRHEEITDPADLAGVRRALWIVNLGSVMDAVDTRDATRLSAATLTGGRDSYADCQEEARRLRAGGASAIYSFSAALKPGEAAGFHTHDGLRRAERWDGGVIGLFGPRPDLVGWQACADGRPNVRQLASVRPF
ncbi:MAG: RES domain-containing protein [Nocardioidaceae bacterium]